MQLPCMRALTPPEPQTVSSKWKARLALGVGCRVQCCSAAALYACAHACKTIYHKVSQRACLRVGGRLQGSFRYNIELQLPCLHALMSAEPQTTRSHGERAYTLGVACRAAMEYVKVRSSLVPAASSGARRIFQEPGDARAL
eukprot:658992-Pelagomonas_calceolata.AAC.2